MTRFILVAISVMVCGVVLNYAENKPVQVPKSTLLDGRAIISEEFKSVTTVSYEADKPMVSEVRMVSRGVPRETNGSFKSYLPYHLITNKSSPAWALQQESWTDGYGFRRWGEFYCCALGSRYSTNIGDKFKIKFDTGVEIYVILADCKSNSDTDKTNSYNTFNDNICEFLVDSKLLHPMAKRMGDVSYGNDDLRGGIVEIKQIVE